MPNPVEIVGGIALGEGVGGAIGAVVEPQLQDLKNTQWGAHALKPLPLELAARLIAENRAIGGVTPSVWAEHDGYGSAVFNNAVELARKYPSLDEALTLARRWDYVTGSYLATQGQLKSWLQYNGFSTGMTDIFAKLLVSRLDPAVVATAVQRSIFKAPPWLPVPDYSAFPAVPNPLHGVPAFTQTALVSDREAFDSGIDDERLRVMTAIVGLPLSLEQAASAYFRKIINLDAFARAVAEGNTRIEWGPAALEQARQILTAGEYAELQLRGFLTEANRRLHTAKHGMTQADSDLLYDVLGRSITVHAVTTGLARGGRYKPPPATLAQQEAGIPADYLAALQRSNIRPEWYDLAYANRYSYPSAFVLRALTQAHDLTQAESEAILLDIGWKPDLALKVSTRWAGGTGAAADPHVKQAKTQLWSTTHRSYLAEESTDADVTPRFSLLGIPAAAQTEILTLWQSERELIRKQLTPAQVKKAFTKLVVNPATGVAWTRDEALAALLARGYSLADANVFLDE